MTIRYKKFADYAAYVKKQGGKISFALENILAKCEARIKGFKKIFIEYQHDLVPGKILCLGARTGCEVQAARQAGFKGSIGIDLHPVGDLVVKGDWHDIPFPDNSFHNVYCNSLDHCMDIEKLVNEIKRVLVSDGIFFFMTMNKQALSTVIGSIEDRMTSRAYDSMFWDTENDIIDAFISSGFVLKKTRQDTKWFYCLLRNKQ